MPKNKWALPVVVAGVIILGGLAYAGILPNVGGSDESAAAANAIKVTTVATAIQKVLPEIATAAANKDAAAIEKAKADYTVAVNSAATLGPEFQKLINSAMARGKDMSAAQATLGDFNTKLSYLQSSTLSLTNAQIDMTNLSAVYADISSIKTAVQAAKK